MARSIYFSGLFSAKVTEGDAPDLAGFGKNWNNEWNQVLLKKQVPEVTRAWLAIVKITWVPRIERGDSIPESTLWGWAPGPWKNKEKFKKAFSLICLFARWAPSTPWYDHVGMLARGRPTLLMERLLYWRARDAALRLMLLMALEVFGVVSLESPVWLGGIRLILKRHII